MCKNMIVGDHAAITGLDIDGVHMNPSAVVDYAGPVHVGRGNVSTSGFISQDDNTGMTVFTVKQAAIINGQVRVPPGRYAKNAECVLNRVE